MCIKGRRLDIHNDNCFNIPFLAKLSLYLQDDSCHKWNVRNYNERLFSI